MKRLSLILLVGLAIVLPGCSDGTLSITGKVTLDGTPLQEGKIRFVPADGQGPTAEAVITAGSYEVALLPGAKKVVIEGWRKVGEEKVTPDDPSSPMIDIMDPIVPERYNKNTELSCEIGAGGEQNFTLVSE
jgi:hypothetical protein